MSENEAINRVLRDEDELIQAHVYRIKAALDPILGRKWRNPESERALRIDCEALALVLVDVAARHGRLADPHFDALINWAVTNWKTAP